MASKETGNITDLEETVGIMYKIGKAFDIVITKTRNYELNRAFAQ